MGSIYRRLLRQLPRLGVNVVDLGGGGAVLSRGDDVQRVALAPDADLVTRGRTFSATRVRKGTWFLTRDRRTATPEWTDVPLGHSGHLLVDESVDDEQSLQIDAAAFLGGHHVAGLLRKYRVNCVFDVGANVGQYGQRLRAAGYTGRIVSFEPTARTFARLQRAAADDPDWHVHHLALGREEATQSINVGWATMNSLLPPSDYGKDQYERFETSRTEEITVRRLDAVIDEALAGLDSPRPYLKMDTQGFDLEVFAGAGDRIADFVGMQSEVAVLRLYEGSPPMSEAIAAYEAGGFEITGMYPVTREKATGRVVEFDCVLMRAAAVPS